MTDIPALQRCSIFGLGKLGSPLAAVLAHKGFTVVGHDLLPAAVERLNAGQSPVEETGLAEMIAANRDRLSATADARAAVHETDVTFVIVPTPSDETGRFSNRAVLKAAESIGDALRDKNGFHLVVLTSTVMPGDTQGAFVPILEERSGKACGTDFGVCYNPEFIALGSVIRDMLAPDFILIGESDPRSGAMLAGLYSRSCENNPPVRRMNFVNAEITKIAVNTFVTTKISYANMLAEVCENLSGADVDVVTQALGSDTRIGPKYLKGATGYGGPCFPRDNKAFSRLARDIGADAQLAEATDRINDRQVERLAALVNAQLPVGGQVGILGLSYKPETPVLEEAQGFLLARRLIEEGHRVAVYDPQAMDSARRALGDAAEYGADAAAVMRDSDVIVIPTAWSEFRALAADGIAGQTKVIVDCWRILPPEWGGDDVRIIYTGQGRLKDETLVNPG